VKLPHVRTSSDHDGAFVTCLVCGALRPIRDLGRRDVTTSGKLAGTVAPVASFRQAHAECRL
jgi:hypothetical protein